MSVYFTCLRALKLYVYLSHDCYDCSCLSLLAPLLICAIFHRSLINQAKLVSIELTPLNQCTHFGLPRSPCWVRVHLASGTLPLCLKPFLYVILERLSKTRERRYPLYPALVTVYFLYLSTLKLLSALTPLSNTLTVTFPLYLGSRGLEIFGHVWSPIDNS